MPQVSSHATDTELAILQVLWDQGPTTRRQITDALYPEGGTAHYATVQKLLERLEAKGLVSTDRSRAVLTFTAAVGRDELIGLRLRDVAEKLCGGSLTPLLMNLVKAEPLKPRELDELQALVDELQAKNRSRSKKR
jgi:predicted transcriptional regulator